MVKEKFPPQVRAVLADCFKSARQKLNITQKQYAKKLLISERHLQRIENNYVEPSALTFSLFLLTLSKEDYEEVLAKLKAAFEAE